MKYFVCANTCTGEVNYLKNNLKDIDKIYLIQSKFEHLKHTFIMRLCAHAEIQVNNIELLHSPLVFNVLDGFIIRNKKIAVVNSSLITADNNCILIDIDSCIKKKKYISLSDEADSINNEIDEKKKCVKSVYEGAKKIHDEWEKIYIENMDFMQLNKYSKKIIDEIVPDKSGNKKNRYDRFFGSAYYDMNVNYIDNITENIEKRYFIKGRPGTGKSTFLKKLADELMSKNYSVEVYHCGFDSNSLDMVVCRELSFCVFDSTSPHEKFPDRDNDMILDFYENSGLLGIDEKFEAKLTDVRLRYSKMISVSKIYLAEINEILREFSNKVNECTDYQKLNNIVYEILYEII